MDFIAAVNRIVGPIKQRIFLMLARGIVTAVSNTNGFQKIAADLLDEENADGLDRYQEYGFAAKPLVGAQALTGFLAGNRSHGVVFCIDDVRYRFTQLENGEVCLFTAWDENGSSEHRIHFREGKIVDLYGDMVNLGSASGLQRLITEAAQDIINDHCHEVKVATLGVPVTSSGPLDGAVATPATVFLLSSTAIPENGYTQKVKGA